MTQKKDSLKEDLVMVHRAALALQSEINKPTVSRLFDEQVKLLQDEKDAWYKYQHLTATTRSTNI